jgi:hypothetical protein
MKYFFRRRVPVADDVLFLESGSPEVARRVLERIRKLLPDARYHLCTCQTDVPPAVFASVFRASDYPAAWQKLSLLYSFRRRGWKILVILCTGEPILWRWKMLALVLLPAKVLVVNENADFFWLEWENRRTLRRLLENRWGVNRIRISRNFFRALVFPLTLLVLLATAGFLCLRRAWRLMLWRIRLRPDPIRDRQEAVLRETQPPR